MDTDNIHYYEHIASYEYVDLVRLLNGKKNLRILRWDSEHPRAILSPGQGGLFAAFQNEEREGRDITIFCGHTAEVWSPLSVKTGIGGSEEAVINISKEFVRLGHKVTVYNNCGPMEGIYDDVAYVNYHDFDPFQQYDVFIGWRNPTLFELPLKTTCSILWLHDVPVVEQFTPEVLKNVHKICVLSKWHRDCLPDVPEDKFYYTRNGVNMDFFDKYAGIDRNPVKVMYASSPDRGLDELLKMWEDVRKEVPEAELHVYYGWKGFDSCRTDADSIAWKQQVLELMKQPGVVNHDRIGHEELAKEFCGAGVWAYPTYFTEISCITAMKAQLAGVIPVCTDVAALDETVQHGHKIRGNIRTAGNQELFKKTLIEVLKNPRPDVKPMQDWARGKFGWNTLAAEWQSLFSQKRTKR
jgi:glycosyltransferase involved in cell wall biosynthesis